MGSLLLAVDLYALLDCRELVLMLLSLHNAAFLYVLPIGMILAVTNQEIGVK